MMNNPTEKQKCIAEQAVYGDLKGIEQVDFTGITYRASDVEYIDIPNIIKLILRPISDLTVEIIHKGYNDDKPFVPIVELAKTQYRDFEIDSIEVMDERSIMCKGYSKELSQRVMRENVKCNCAYWFHPLSSERCDEERDLLHLLHFDTRNLIKKGDAVDVNTLDINPYSV